MRYRVTLGCDMWLTRDPDTLALTPLSTDFTFLPAGTEILVDTAPAKHRDSARSCPACQSIAAGDPMPPGGFMHRHAPVKRAT